MRLHKPVLRASVPVCVLAGVSVAAWAAWLGWDQQYDVRPDGSTSGPYAVWQVVGLVLTLLVPVCWAAARGHSAAAVGGTTAGLTLAACVDWADDASGLFVVGVVLVMAGTFVATAVVSAVIDTLRRDLPLPR
ncbi:hypothetical protein [Streptomyces hyaluromycini]|uniref:hypothetical protein n=1 Tax=Streptomyces hyaluromycini TaxID=1377993 RepID=UPI000B5C88E7|nr:hypothetical protein [Streptomyces hyaluromycini]